MIIINLPFRACFIQPIHGEIGDGWFFGLSHYQALQFPVVGNFKGPIKMWWFCSKKCCWSTKRLKTTIDKWSTTKRNCCHVHLLDVVHPWVWKENHHFAGEVLQDFRYSPSLLVMFFYRGPLPFWITKLNKLITIPSILITIDPFLTKFWLSFAKIKKETKWTTSPTNQSPDALKALIPLIAQALNGGGGAKISVIHQNMKSQINIALNVVDWLNYYGNIP
jgi:hypothetical protein